MKKIFKIILLIAFLIVLTKSNVLNEPEELIKMRENYNEIYGEKAKYFVFSK